jgi:hypothetical protein
MKNNVNQMKEEYSELELLFSKSEGVSFFFPRNYKDLENEEIKKILKNFVNILINGDQVPTLDILCLYHVSSVEKYLDIIID